MWVRPSRAIVLLGGVAVVFAGCAPSVEPASVDPASTGQPTTEETDDFGEPEIEVPGTEEEPADGQPEAIAVQLPGLPIGGSSAVVSDTLQCAEINWSGPPDLRDGVRIRVTAISFDPPDSFALSSESCPGTGPPCLPDHLLSTDSPTCTVPVAWTGEQPGEAGTLFFSAGELLCQPVAGEGCTEFRDEVVAREPEGIALEPSPPASSEDATDGADQTTEASDGSADGGDDATGEADGGDDTTGEADVGDDTTGEADG